MRCCAVAFHLLLHASPAKPRIPRADTLAYDPAFDADDRLLLTRCGCRVLTASEAAAVRCRVVAVRRPDVMRRSAALRVAFLVH